MPADALYGAGLVVVGGITRAIAHSAEQRDISATELAG